MFQQLLSINDLEVRNILPLKLQEILAAGVEIIRFTGGDLPEHVVIDNVRDHTVRCVNLVMRLVLPEDQRSKLARILLLHDLPEIESLRRLGRKADLTAPEKHNNPKLAQTVAELERTVAKEIFSTDDYGLYLEFEKASDYLKYPYGPKPDGIAMLAKLVDVIDACWFLHQSLTNWAVTADYVADQFRPQSSLAYVFVNLPIIAVLFSHTEDLTIRQLGLDIIEELRRAVGLMWSSLEQQGIEPPPEILDYIPNSFLSVTL